MAPRSSRPLPQQGGTATGPSDSKQRTATIWAWGVALLVLLPVTCAAETNPALTPLSPLPPAGPSVLRVFGALAVVLGVFLGGVWLVRNGRQFRFRQGRAPRLNVLESRSLGGRHALYVVGYEQERFLIASTPNGISLVSQLPSGSADASAQTQPEVQAAPALSFAQTLAQVLKNQPLFGSSSGGGK